MHPAKQLSRLTTLQTRFGAPSSLPGPHLCQRLACAQDGEPLATRARISQ